MVFTDDKLISLIIANSINKAEDFKRIRIDERLIENVSTHIHSQLKELKIYETISLTAITTYAIINLLPPDIKEETISELIKLDKYKQPLIELERLYKHNSMSQQVSTLNENKMFTQSLQHQLDEMEVMMSSLLRSNALLLNERMGTWRGGLASTPEDIYTLLQDPSNIKVNDDLRLLGIGELDRQKQKRNK